MTDDPAEQRCGITLGDQEVFLDVDGETLLVDVEEYDEVRLSYGHREYRVVERRIGLKLERVTDE
jgi:hypothetical protein